MLCIEGSEEDQKEALRGNLQLPETMTSRPSAFCGKKTTVKVKTYRRMKNTDEDARPLLKENPPLDYSVIFKEPAGPSNSLHSKFPSIVIQTNVSRVGDFPP